MKEGWPLGGGDSPKVWRSEKRESPRQPRRLPPLLRKERSPTAVLCKSCPRAAGFVAFAAENGAAHLWLERHLIVFSAVITNDIETLWSVFTGGGLLRPALGASLWGHHVALVKNLLFFFGEKKGGFTLHARDLDVRHMLSPCCT